MGMPSEETATQGTHIVFSSKDGNMSLRLPSIVAVYIARASTVANVVYELEELYMVGMECFQEFSRESLSLADQMHYSLRVEESWHFKDCLRINRCLSSLFTVLRMYSDNVRKLFAGSQEKVRRLFSMPGYKELDALRNYVQHVSFLPLRRCLSCTLCDPDVALSSCRFELDNVKMLLGEVDNPRTKERLREILEREHVDIYELVMEGMAAFRRIHKIVRSTKCFTSDYADSQRFLRQLHDLTIEKGMDCYVLEKDGQVLMSDKAYFSTATIAMITEIRSGFPTDTVYPANKIYPSVAPAVLLEKYKEQHPINAWHKEAAARVQAYDALLADYSLNSIIIDFGLQGIDKLSLELSSIEETVTQRGC